MFIFEHSAKGQKVTKQFLLNLQRNIKNTMSKIITIKFFLKIFIHLGDENADLED